MMGKSLDQNLPKSTPSWSRSLVRILAGRSAAMFLCLLKSLFVYRIDTLDNSTEQTHVAPPSLLQLAACSKVGLLTGCIPKRSCSATSKFSPCVSLKGRSGGKNGPHY